ncbi:serine/threonine protein kinase [Massilia sp. B-10]|nr:serine/threonine protein kinase [Massilia sp. B-10]
MKKPERLGPYTLIAPLGDQARARTWLARGRRRRAAPESGAQAGPRKGQGRPARILHELDIAAVFDHPNIVRIHECAEANGVLWLASGYVPGPHEPLKLLNFRQLLLALVHVHANDVIHADLSCANMLLDEEGDLRLSNFASARRAGEPGRAATGNLEFMSPEQLRGEPIDVRSDLFSAGAVLYQILTGKAPFAGSTLAAMPQLTGDSQPPPSSVSPGLGTSFDELISRALARDKAARFSGAFEMLSAFDAACKRGVRTAG